MTYANGNLDPGLGQVHKCGGVKLHATIPLQLKEKLHFYAKFSFYCGSLRANCIVYIFVLLFVYLYSDILPFFHRDIYVINTCLYLLNKEHSALSCGYAI
jgi:hypothetical protein